MHGYYSAQQNASSTSTPTNIFVCIRVGLPAVRVGRVADKVAAYSHPAALWWPSGGHEGATGVGRVAVSGDLLEANTTEVEQQAAQRWARG